MKIIGRIINKRRFKKIIFLKLINIRKDIQIVFNKKIELLDKKLKIGHIIKVFGKHGKTKSGQESIFCEKLIILKKCKKFPNKYFNNINKEFSYRKRYIDLVINKKSRFVFKKRFSLIKNIRLYFYKKKFTEVETPILNNIYAGADSKPFKTMHNFLKKKNYLRISPELYLKKLIVGGYERIFEIGKNFRNENCSKIHNPEFSMIEYYIVDINYLEIMRYTKKMLLKVIKKTIGQTKIVYKNNNVDFKKFETLKIKDAVLKYRNIKYIKKSFLIKEIIKKTKIISYKKENLMYQYFDEYISKKIIKPTFIIGHPKIFSPLALERNGFVERFELYICGIEIANGFSELNSAKEQEKRFKYQKKEYDMDYIEALKFGLPKTSGCGIGLDRLVMIITNSNSIRDVILFPFMK
ncbi:amino acid--tRNA ligase-related protein [Candidatus Vidania fulgoroideorum]